MESHQIEGPERCAAITRKEGRKEGLWGGMEQQKYIFVTVYSSRAALEWENSHNTLVYKLLFARNELG